MSSGDSNFTTKLTRREVAVEEKVKDLVLVKVEVSRNRELSTFNPYVPPEYLNIFGPLYVYLLPN